MFNVITVDLKMQEIAEGRVLAAPAPKEGRRAHGRMYGIVNPGYTGDDLPIDLYLLLFGDVLERVKQLNPKAGDILRVTGTLHFIKKQNPDGEEVRYLQVIASSVEFSSCADANLCYLMAEGIVSDSADKEILKVFENGNFCRFTIGSVPPGRDENWINLKCLSFNTERVQKMKLKKGSSVRVCGDFFRREFDGKNGVVTYNELTVSKIEYFKKKADSEKSGGRQSVREAENGEAPGVNS
jgi:single-stranded DNA-binding protein